MKTWRRPAVARCVKWPCSDNAKVTDLAHLRRPLEDELADVFRQQCARDIGRDILYQLRGHVDNELVGVTFQTVLVRNGVII
jgi:hypothetical protein